MELSNLMIIPDSVCYNPRKGKKKRKCIIPNTTDHRKGRVISLKKSAAVPEKKVISTWTHICGVLVRLLEIGQVFVAYCA